MPCFSGKNILIIDDDKEMIYSYKAILKKAGYGEMRQAYTGEEGIQLALEWRPDLIISDVQHSGPDGFEVFIELSSRPDPLPAKFMIVSGYHLGHHPEFMPKLIASGVAAYLEKPIEPAEFIRRIEGVFRDSEVGAQAVGPVPPAEKKYGPWTKLFMPGEGSVFKTPGGNKRIHDIQASDMKYFFDCYLHMPGSIFRFNELRICKSLFAGLLESLGPIRADSAPEVKEWQDAFRAFAWAVQALDVEMLAKAVKNLQETSDLEFREAQRLAETAVPVMRGYVDLNHPYCPLCPVHDPDTDWDRWALKISPLENWKFFNNFFWVSDGETREKGMPTIRMPSLFLHPELYKREYDDTWHSIWGFTAFGAFKPHLKDAPELLARVVGADAACWEAFRSGKAPAIKAAAEKWLETALLLLERPEAAVRGRAAYWFTRNSLFSEKPYDSISARFLFDFLAGEKDVEVQRCILAALIYRNPFTRHPAIWKESERGRLRLTVPEATCRRWPELVSELFGVG